MKQTWILREHTVQNIIQHIAKLPFDKYRVTVEPAETRSLAQNRLYWAWMRQISEKYGEAHGEYFAPEYFHQYLKRLFLGQEPIEINGNKLVVMQSTSKLGIKAMAEYMERVEIWAGEVLELQMIHNDDYHFAMNDEQK